MTAYITTLLRESGRKVLCALLLMVGLGGLEGAGLLMLLPMLDVLGLAETPGQHSGISALLGSLLHAVGLSHSLVTVLGVYILIISVHAVLVRYHAILINDLQHSFIQALSYRLYTAITYTRWEVFVRTRSSEVTQLLTAALSRVGQGTYDLLCLMSTGILLVIYVALAIQLSPVMAALSCLSAAVLLLGLGTRHRTTKETGATLGKASNRLYAAVTEHLHGMKEAKSYGAERRHIALFAEITRANRSLWLHFVRRSADTKMYFDIGTVVVVSVVIYVAVAMMQMSAARLLLLLFLYARLLPRCSALQQSYQQLLHMLPAFNEVMAMQERCAAAAEPMQADMGRSIHVQRSIQLQQVGFRYDPAADTATIQDCSCTILARQTTALVGPSGAGKSTIADLLMGLLVPDQGTILVDGIPLQGAWLGAWRQTIGYVPQDTFLLHDTVRANLLWAWPEASEADIDRALQGSAADAMVAALPQGLDTILGDRGVRLSGGERQRIALARALLRRPSLLLLDEATSALDTANEQRIYQALTQLHGELTIVIITHRLSTVRSADHILVVEAGRIVETGVWDDLWDRPDGRFRALAGRVAQ